MSKSGGKKLVHLILNRRSIRSGFIPKEVPDVIIDQIVGCGINAPSSKNAQPWRLHVVKDVELLGQIASRIEEAKGIEDFRPWSPKSGRPRPEYRSSVVESAEILRAAPLAIFVENKGLFADRRVDVQDVLVRSGGTYSLVGFALEYIGIGAAIENVLLAAQALDVRGVFMGDVLVAEDFIRESLEMSGDLVGAISLGYSNGEPDPKVLHRDNVVWHRS